MPWTQAHSLHYSPQAKNPAVWSDSGWYPKELASPPRVTSLTVIIDCTMGNPLRLSGHGTFSEAVQIKERMLGRRHC